MRTRRASDAGREENGRAVARYRAAHPEWRASNAAYHRRRRMLLKLRELVVTLEERDAWILAAYAGGRPQAEIAADLNITQQAVSLRLVRAMKVLREAARREKR